MRQRAGKILTRGWIVAATGVACAAALATGGLLPAQASPHQVASSRPDRMQVNCANGPGYSDSSVSVQCPDVFNPLTAYGHYVGHDEPGVWFDSNVPGSGNRARWQLTLPVDPGPSSVPGQKDLQLRAARRVLVRHGNMRQPVLPGATVDLHARLRQQHRRSQGQLPARRVGLPGASVLPAGFGRPAQLDLLRRDPLVRGNERLVLLLRPGHRAVAQHRLPVAGRRSGAGQLRVRHQGRQARRRRRIRWTRPPPRSPRHQTCCS